MSTVRYSQGELPQISEERKAELKALAERPDSEIDYSDIPPLDETFWARAVPQSVLQAGEDACLGADECDPARGHDSVVAAQGLSGRDLLGGLAESRPAARSIQSGGLQLHMHPLPQLRRDVHQRIQREPR